VRSRWPFEPNPAADPDPQGAERIEFLVAATRASQRAHCARSPPAANSRAFRWRSKVAALGLDAVPSMVFDEVDSGIGGAVADIVGQKLRALGGKRQVLCVTHLPQVAAQGLRTTA
jgi:DNA repair protein RecN (Recombination protein N)